MERHEYAEAAHLLEAVQQLSSHFQSYVHIPKVAELKGRLTALERSLQINTMREFELLGEETPSPLLLERLRSCCMVVEALGYQVGAAGLGWAWEQGAAGRPKRWPCRLHQVIAPSPRAHPAAVHPGCLVALPPTCARLATS